MLTELFRTDRIERYLSDLSDLIYKDSISLQLYKIDGYYKSPAEVSNKIDKASIFTPHERWGGRNSYTWFHSEIVLPEIMAGKQLYLTLATTEGEQRDNAILAGSVGKKNEKWDLMNPQFLLFINGKIYSGADTNHTSIFIPAEITANKITIDFQGYAGLTDNYYTFSASLHTINEKVRDLYYDILTYYEVACSMANDNPEKQKILSTINTSLNMLDLRSENICSQAENASLFIKSELLAKIQPDININCIGHSHIDVAWLWDLKQTREKTKRTFSSVLQMMKRYPDYKFLQSTPQLYKFIKEEAPEIYEEIKERIKEGRWEAEGAMFLEADCNIPSGESLVRQIMYGKRFFKEEFGVDSHILWLPDVFGYSAALPQILTKSGINTFVTTKISWNILNKMPYDTFLWKGISKETILTYFITAQDPDDNPEQIGTTYNAQLHPKALYKSWQRYQQKGINQNLLFAYGFGDGGGGPTEEMLEKGKRLKEGVKGFPSISFNSISDYFSSLHAKIDENRYLPTWSGELYLELHQGTYTSMADIKRNNRKAEQALHSVELWASLSSIIGKTKYPTEEIRAQWEILLLNQFHDILPGSCIKQVYIDSAHQFEELFLDLENMERTAQEIIFEKKDNKTFTILNNLGFEGQGPVLINTENPPEYIVSSDGKEFPVQQIDDNTAISYVKDIPSFGWKTFTGKNKSKNHSNNGFKNILENDDLLIKFTDKGEISSIFHKKLNQEFLKPGNTANKIIAYDDRPKHWENWNIDLYYEEKNWVIDNLADAIEYTEGSVFKAITVKRKFNKSAITQIIRLYNESDIVEFDSYIDWKEDSTALKTVFPTVINSDIATYDIQFGNLKRPTHYNTSWDIAKYEVCAHKWMDLSEGNMGLSILNDSKYGCDIHDGVMRLTLLKSGLSPWDQIDRGSHHFKYAIYPHAGSPYDAETHKKAQIFNMPLTFLNHISDIDSYCLIKCDANNILIDTVKIAEDSNNLVVRLYEHKNMHTHFSIEIAEPFSSVFETDLLENPIKELSFNKQKIDLYAEPFEIKTLMIKIKGEE